MLKTLDEKILDRDWIHLMEEAKQIGLQIDEVKIFLSKQSSVNSK
ncbi:DNA-binding anti-repressor SinI [Virgibacillus senegalensis]|nr:DNA-binding anti-repressor SinI [Virgibacillus senegalensis]